MVLTHGAAEGGNFYKDMGSVLTEAEPVASWLNQRLAARLGGGMVGTAQELGAVVATVEKTPEKAEIGLTPIGLDDSKLVQSAIESRSAPIVISDELKNRADLQDWVEKMGWSREDLIGPLKKAGYEDSKHYLKTAGNTIQGLAGFLLSELGPDEEGKDAAW